MGIFAVRGRRSPAGVDAAGGELSPTARMGLPPRFEAVAEALAANEDIEDRCVVVGQQLAHDGASVEEALAGLRETVRVVTGVDPSFDAVSALLGGWSEATLGYLNHLSCTDPLTGLASQSHLRACLGERYRTPGVDVSADWALVVCQMPDVEGPDRLERSLEVAGVGEHARTVFCRDDVVARVGVARVAVLTRRDEHLGRRVRLLRLLLNDGRSLSRFDQDGAAEEGVPDLSTRVRVWIEGLPHADGAVGVLLDDLAR